MPTGDANVPTASTTSNAVQKPPCPSTTTGSASSLLEISQDGELRSATESMVQDSSWQTNETTWDRTALRKDSEQESESNAMFSHNKANVYDRLDEEAETDKINPSPNDSAESDPSQARQRFTARQWLLLTVLSVATLTCSFAICLFPPFYPKIAEDKGATASIYGFVIGTNCLVSFLVTPIIGKNLKVIGVRFAFVSGIFIGGVCTILSGFLEYFPPGMAFIGISIAIRMVHAAGNAGTVTSTFTYTAVEFPDSVAKIFSLTRTMMNVAQLAGPIIGGALYEWGGFKTPFIVMGCIQTAMAFISYPFLPDYDISQYDKENPNKKSKSVLRIMCVPAIWISFFTFIVSTISNGFLSINLEPKVLRRFDLTPFYVGLFFGLKDGTNSIASPIWGILCDRKGSVKPYIISSTLLGALSLFLLGPFPYVPIPDNLTVVGIALGISGVAFGGQQVAGVVDALREAVHAGYPDDPGTHGLIAGLWSSLSGAGRFVSRAGTGILVDYIGFQMTALIVFILQLAVVLIAVVYCIKKRIQRRKIVEEDLKTHPELVASLASEANAPMDSARFEYSLVESGDFSQVSVTQPSSPAESLFAKSVSIPIPRLRRKKSRGRSETFSGFSG